MFTNAAKKNSKKGIFKAAAATLPLLFIVVLCIGQALAYDDREDNDRHRGDSRDYKRHHRLDACAQTSLAALTACKYAAWEDYNLALGNCANVAKSEQRECKALAQDDFGLALEECTEQFDARQEICDAIGPGPYLPKGIDPDDFAEKPKGNSYFPLEPGTKYTYKNYAEGGGIQETIVVEVKDEIREIEGVACRVVQDTVYEGDGMDEKIEDTTDWYAFKDGDVWYFGEIALNYEDGVVSNIDGSWTAGAEGAKPGINMYADPSAHIGETYRQEFAIKSEAEDVATIVEILTYKQFEENVLSPVPDVFGSGPFLHTKDFSPLEPGVVEDKYYGWDVGNVLIVNEDTGEMEILESKTP